MNERAGSEATEVELGQRRVESRGTDKRSRDKADKGKRQNACGNRDKNEQMRRYRVLGTNSIRLSFSVTFTPGHSLPRALSHCARSAIIRGRARIYRAIYFFIFIRET